MSSKKSSPKDNQDSDPVARYRVVKVAETGTLKIPGATVLKGADIPLTKSNAEKLNAAIPGCVVMIGI